MFGLYENAGLRRENGNMEMQMVENAYRILVNRVPGIRERYQKMRNRNRRMGKQRAWIYLIYLNLAYYLFRKTQLGYPEKYPYYEKKKLYCKGSESSLSKRKSPREFAKELGEYDVISFDVFDTLIFRMLDKPEDLFFFVGEKLDYMDFKRIRQEMERKCREKKYQREKHYEISLDEIYSLLSRETGISKNEGMKLELETEEKFCFANPYMKEVVQELRKQGKRMIILSDMYLHTKQIQALLFQCGYGVFDGYYVSCDYKCSKSRGDLYEVVRTQEERKMKRTALSFVHVGDHPQADIEHAEKHCFSSRYYKNIHLAGEPYRAEDLSVVTGSLYRGLVNTRIHNGRKIYSREYEYGYIYGGLFVTGYCQFIHKYARDHGTELLLFLARDGNLLFQAYKRLYPLEGKRCRYVYWSRLAGTKMCAAYFKYDYFRRFLFHKVNQKHSLKEIFSSMELEDMLEEFCKTSAYTRETMLTDQNIEQVKEFFLQRWECVLQHYEEQISAGRSYFEAALLGCQKAAVIDIGWAGSGAITLEYLIQKVWKFNCSVTGILAGTNTCHNEEMETSETFLQKGKLVSYLYSQRENRDLWKFHDPGKNHNLYWEMLLDAPHGSFQGFYLDNRGRIEYRMKKSVADPERIREIHRGVLDFVSDWKKICEKIPEYGQISGRDAYAPMLNVMSRENKEFRKYFYSLKDEKNIG